MRNQGIGRGGPPVPMQGMPPSFGGAPMTGPNGGNSKLEGLLLTCIRMQCHYLLLLEIRYGPMMGGPPPGPMPHNGPPGSYGGGPQRGGYHGGMGRDQRNGPPRFNDRGYQNDSGKLFISHCLALCCSFQSRTSLKQSYLLGILKVRYLRGSDTLFVCVTRLNSLWLIFVRCKIRCS